MQKNDAERKGYALGLHTPMVATRIVVDTNFTYYGHLDISCDRPSLDYMATLL